VRKCVRPCQLRENRGAPPFLRRYSHFTGAPVASSSASRVAAPMSHLFPRRRIFDMCVVLPSRGLPGLGGDPPGAPLVLASRQRKRAVTVFSATRLAPWRARRSPSTSRCAHARYVDRRAHDVVEAHPRPTTNAKHSSSRGPAARVSGGRMPRGHRRRRPWRRRGELGATRGCRRPCSRRSSDRP